MAGGPPGTGILAPAPCQCRGPRILPDRSEPIPPYRQGDRRTDGARQEHHLPHTDGAVRSAGGSLWYGVLAPVAGIGFRDRNRRARRRRVLGVLWRVVLHS